jgi:hypothetical protein
MPGVGPHEKMTRLLTSFGLSIIIVGSLLGNAHLYCNIGYPSLLRPVGLSFVFVGVLLAIPPGLVYLMLSYIGLVPELRGRESFIQLNPALWIFCFLFYTLAIHFIRLLWHRRKHRQSTDNGKSMIESKR